MDLLLTAGRLALNVGIAVAVLLGVTSVTLRLVERFAQREFFQVPLFFSVAKLLGAALGVALLYEQYQRRYFDLGPLFQPESAWNISVWQFLIERTNPVFYAPFALVAASSERGAVPAFLLVAGLLLLIGAAYLVAYRLWQPGNASRSIALTLLLALWIAYVILFGVSLIFWLLFWLNIWSLLIVALFVQRLRYRA